MTSQNKMLCGNTSKTRRKYWIYLAVILKLVVCSHAVVVVAGSSSFPSSPSLTTCKCIRLKDCKPYANLLNQREQHQTEIVTELIKNAACGFQNLDLKVCCPTIELRSAQLPRNSRQPIDMHNGAWVWDRYRSDDSNLENIIDYKDKKTSLNSPHIFYEENDRYNEDNQYHYRFHVTHSHQNPVHERFNDYDDDSDKHAEGAIIFPGNVRPRNRNLMPTSGTTKLTSQNAKPKDLRIVYPDDKRLRLEGRNREQAKAVTEAVNNFTIYEASGSSNSEIFQNSPECGLSISMRLLGGTQATEGQFPWITRIAYINTTSQRISYRCSGSVISQLFVLTAAHCVTDLVDDLKLSHVRIGDGSSTENTLTYGITDVIIHPNYDQPKYANDMALLKLIRAQNEGQLSTICLPLDSSFANADRLIDKTGVVAGWSTVNRDEVSSNGTVKYLRLPIVNNTQCAITYAKYTENFHVPIIITPAHLCARSTDDMRDVCQGDSGGPFMDDGMSGIANTNGRYTLLGIVAFGPTVCGTISIPGVYMRVSSFIDWIVVNLR